MSQVRAKKNLGQHFLTDLNIARRIVDSVQHREVSKVLEVGPGMGVLTQYLIGDDFPKVYPVEIDVESVVYLKEHYPILSDRIYDGDFLKMDFKAFSNEPIVVVGNFPYNISTQIYFKILENRDQVVESVGMIQKEVAERICSSHGSKIYGILSVLLQAFYDVEYLFTVGENVFNPPPKVKSAVIRITRNSNESLPCDEALFYRVVKAIFNQRRKAIRNSLKSVCANVSDLDTEMLQRRPEQMSVSDFIELTCMVEKLIAK
ncbi:16S rRNA (adenine(1518)-N(6)/adenine(1519)-N(6))-dimethyltransferase RsmA [Halosquirtibacter laminarini]|uniref:16S rRNA (Adenine(1518)-N(6)/adenine(1519)-N(6))-dimethyltransferase RsmA n=1 Tax=Halosquirtibacter laminarini TaxID=3374600 RepID=A0AC61NG13_9BACT|nr:16S rRNA (adenine(1518)-N(6)/adenine(1519)-N(6))-dimethyltransferase RsmA [Prolixibacteraceae bacterium]